MFRPENKHPQIDLEDNFVCGRSWLEFADPKVAKSPSQGNPFLETAPG
jgi:hypothetical protein